LIFEKKLLLVMKQQNEKSDNRNYSFETEPFIIQKM